MAQISLPTLKVRPKKSDLDHVYAELKRSIMMCEFVPGQKLKLDDLAAAFETSHMPVREALNRLVMAGALEASHRRSTAIPSATPERLRHLLELRIDLEGKAVAMAVNNGDPALLTQLKQINARMDIEAERGPDIKTYLRLNHRFHFTLYEQCGNPELVDLIELLWMRYGPLLSLHSLKSTPAKLSYHRHHHDIIEAVAAFDAKAAAHNVMADLAEAGAAIAAALEASEPRNAAQEVLPTKAA